LTIIMKRGIIVLSHGREQMPVNTKGRITVRAEDENDVHYWWHFLIVKGCREISLVSGNVQVVLSAFC